MTRNSSLLISVAVFLTAFLHVSNISNYVLSLRLGYVQWHFWVVSILVCLALALFSGRVFKLPKLSLSYILWVSLFLGLCALSLLLVDNGETAIQGMITYCWFFASGLVLVLLVRNPADVKACGAGIVVGVSLLAVLSIMEFIDPNFQVIVDAYFEDKARVGEANRAGALYENPNDNGTAMVLGMFLGQFFLPVRLRFAFMIFVGVAIFATVSRTSITIWAAAVVLSLLLGFGAKSKILSLIGLAVVIVLGYLLAVGQIPVLVAELGLEDLLSRDMTNRLSENFFTQSDNSTLVRIEIAQLAWKEFLANPLTGIGIGASDNLGFANLGTHNQHLKIASELGIVGFLVYAALGGLAIFSRSMIAIVFLILYAAIGFTNHGLMNYTVYAVLLPSAFVFIPDLRRFENAEQNRKRRKRRSSRQRSRSIPSRDVSEIA